MIKSNTLYIAWIIALVATLLSLFIGEVLGNEPCNLCWYQRICLFPLSIILGMAYFRKDVRACIYVIPQVVIGALLALYQFAYPRLLPYFGVIPKCTFGKDCTTSPFEIFGFVDLPFLSFCTFLLLLILLIISICQKPHAPENIDTNIEDQ